MRASFIIICVLLPFSAGVVNADTINIPTDYPTIQQGIDAAVNGDTVLVAPGTYVENINFLGKAITVKSRSGPSSTTIDGSGPTDSRAGSVVTFNSGEELDSVLDGFLLRGGEGTSLYKSRGPNVGGGIYCTNQSSPKIKNSIIRTNKASEGAGMYCDSGDPQLVECSFRYNDGERNGGGLYLLNSDAVLKGCSFYGNRIDSILYGLGAGLCNYSGRTLLIDCEFSSNSNYCETGRGGGIYNFGGELEVIRCTFDRNYVVEGINGAGLHTEIGTVDLTDCTFYSNYSYKGNTYGGGIYSDKCNLYLKRCIFSYNIASLRGGGIHGVSSDMELDNCIFLRNEGSGGGLSCSGGVVSLTCCTFTNNTGLTVGGGLYCDNGAIVDMTNTIVWNNDTPDGSEIWLADSANPSTLSISYTDLDGGLLSIHTEPGCTINWGQGMIDADPLFANPYWDDIHLTYQSPCRDSGDDTVSGLPSSDFEGDRRIYEDTVDMGADEFHPHLYILRKDYPSTEIHGKLVGLPGTMPAGVFLGSGILETPVPTSYGDFFLLPPWILIPLVPIPSTGILVIRIWPPARYDIPMQGLVGLNSDSLTNLCVLEVR